jgi:hypothetical protein
MESTTLELPLDLEHHTARVRVHADPNGGWDVTTELDGRAIATDYCPDWRRVERFHARMQRWLQDAEAESLVLSSTN